MLETVSNVFYLGFRDLHYYTIGKIQVAHEQTKELRIGKREKATESFDSIALVPHIRVELMIYCVRGSCPGPLDECGSSVFSTSKTFAKIRIIFELAIFFFNKTREG